MNDRIYTEFEKFLSQNEIGKTVLEIGAVPSSQDILLNSKYIPNDAETIGIDLVQDSHSDHQMIQGNANNMHMFEDNYFDCILCNSVLEHDAYFWKTIGEIRRVASDNALVIIGVPAYTHSYEYKSVFDLFGVTKLVNYVDKKFENEVEEAEFQAPTKYDYPHPHKNKNKGTRKLLSSLYQVAKKFNYYRPETVTYWIHSAPYDYYRFSEYAMRDVFFEGYKIIGICEVMKPPRLIGCARNKVPPEE